MEWHGGEEKGGVGRERKLAWRRNGKAGEERAEEQDGGAKKGTAEEKRAEQIERIVVVENAKRVQGLKKGDSQRFFQSSTRLKGRDNEGN